MTRAQLFRRPVTVALAAALATLAALSVFAPAPAANALGSRSVALELLDTGTLPLTTPAGITVDSGTHRGFVVEPSSKRITVLDLSGEHVSTVVQIPTGLGVPASMALDEASHRLLVADLVGPSAVLIDVDPASPTANTVVSTISTGLAGAQWVAIDDDIAFAGQTGDSSTLVSRIDLRDGSTTSYDVGPSRKPLVFDPVTHTAYAAMSANRILSIDRLGVADAHAVSLSAKRLAFDRGHLFIASDAAQVVSYDVGTWTATSTSPVLSGATGMVADPETGTLFVSTGTDITLLNLDNLALEGAVSAGFNPLGVDLDRSSRRVIAAGPIVGAGTGFSMWGAEPTVTRVSGADRYEVSAAISRERFGATPPVAYVASGAVFPDALSASAAAGARGGPVLLVQKDRIPAVIDAELQRLQPDRIIVLGGLATIDASVEAALKAYSAKVVRIGGADRYEVSAAVSHEAFTPGQPVAFVAAGATFPDALSGSAAAGKLGGPVLLTTRDSIPASVEAELRRIAPGKIVVLGGTNSVSELVVTALKAIQPSVSRVAGADRFDVSAGVSAATFPTPTGTVFVASGQVFPDALSGAAAAIAKGSPVLLVTADTIPASVATELTRLKPSRIVVLGGPNSVSTAVEKSLRGYVNN